MKISVAILFPVLCLAVKVEPVRYESSIDAMGSTFSIAAYGEDQTTVAAAVESALEEARRLDHLLSNYRKESEWTRINERAPLGPHVASQELFDLLSACVGYSKASNGAFDITVGPLMRVWGFYKGSGRFPHRSQIRTALAHVGYQYIDLDAKTRTVHFLKSQLEIDPGGIGKGYAIDRMAEILLQAGVRQALLNAGGSSMLALGSPPGENGWKVVIRDPRDSRKVVEELRLQDQSMATSGNYEKFFRVGRKVYSHIMDPRTGYPAQGTYSVSVVAPRGIDSEAWTKPVYINGRQWAATNLPKGFRAYVCEDKGVAQCAWLR
jgi:FAD:protein FMN transferase